MAYTSTHQVSEGLLNILARPFVAIGNMLVALAEASTMAQEAKRVADMSDADLEAAGLTREQAIAEVFGAQAHL
ncbi:hypothetical protein SAMN05444287_1856 [Octadecabacter temperatus]|jgi:hypothetical protein|uniref:Uncharacterized protein n=1 Tax=Octadecabacter temperatus TaxID=1458307 RepID=A0A0K0Y705_9RHOB|nr:hypothetical protein [Octadecabacter temperatus]AKS46733.1 hypothetical protein OSB_21960 [Octadecabacter temperatus]SIO20202.1 hypothetical protein SAMN05444287_1856 [Octadecabacter temperatus]